VFVIRFFCFAQRNDDEFMVHLFIAILIITEVAGGDGLLKLCWNGTEYRATQMTEEA